MKEIRTKPSACPGCGTVLDCATPCYNKDDEPKPDDLTICVKCLAYLQYNDDLSLRALSPEAFAQLDNEQALLLMRARKMLARMFDKMRAGEK